MIQRIQSVYFLIALICVLLMLWFPLFSIEISTVIGTEKITSTTSLGPNGLVGDLLGTTRAVPLYLIYVLLALLIIVCFMMYKKRKRQILLTRLTLVLHILVVLGIYAFYFFGKPVLLSAAAVENTDDLIVQFSTKPGFFILVAAIPFLLLALRGIKHDEQLVKSLDRLR
ncbi:MAG: DUF4293 domain-containing protein [Crocinitomicaceae bacterium]|nr:DUF4293 domain-containing protein [Crocinitomicaceae bacterium]MBK8925979.1 DUF4293 domain-containing protein [Crocinitomicaceae bacterium]